MSKVKRFSLEERYGYQNRKVIYDKNADTDVELNNIYPIIDLLNQLDDQISGLQHRLEVAERTTKLACDCVPCKFCPNGNEDGYCCKTSEIWDSSDDYECNTAKFNHFKEQAEKEIKGEKL